MSLAFSTHQCSWSDDQLGPGTIVEEVDEDGWVQVEWDHEEGSRNGYRMGSDGKYDLKLVCYCSCLILKYDFHSLASRPKQSAQMSMSLGFLSVHEL